MLQPGTLQSLKNIKAYFQRKLFDVMSTSPTQPRKRTVLECVVRTRADVQTYNGLKELAA